VSDRDVPFFVWVFSRRIDKAWLFEWAKNKYVVVPDTKHPKRDQGKGYPGSARREFKAA